jgi:hypothetical protein
MVGDTALFRCKALGADIVFELLLSEASQWWIPHCFDAKH